MKCGRLSCIGTGIYQPLIRIKASVLPASGNDVLSVIRLPFMLCLKCKLQATTAEILACVPKSKMAEVMRLAKEKTGSSPNPDRTDVHWIRITGRPNGEN